MNSVPSMVFDVAVIGAGFGGSLMALILQRLGLRPVLIDRASHPRFAIGESATPIGDLIWSQLAKRFDLPRLAPLAEFGSWQRAYPELPCGLKRGFSYFLHRPQQRYMPSAGYEDELLVAASQGDDDADTHWYRAAFDAFICDTALQAGIAYYDQTQLAELRAGNDWELTGTRLGQPVTLRAKFVIDASGEGGVLARHLGLQNQVAEMQTNSRPLFAHFRGIPSWDHLHGHEREANAAQNRATIEGVPSRSNVRSAGDGRHSSRHSSGHCDPAIHPFSRHPYPCDDAVLHHVFEGGWMWVIPFNNGITSAGFALDQRHFPLREEITPQAEWESLLDRYPSIGDHLRDATICGPADQLVRGRRMQRWMSQAAGPNWALLPTATAFLDPLHSTGNAHTLSGIERLAGLFAQHLGRWDEPGFHTGLRDYNLVLQAETRLLDRIIHGCYLTLGDMDLFGATSAFYFVPAIWAEARRRSGEWQPHEAFLGAHDVAWRQIVEQSYGELTQLMSSEESSSSARRAFIERVRQRIAPYNLAGLCDPDRHNLYPYPVTASHPVR